MKKIIINEQEKNRILEMYKKTTLNSNLLKEQNTNQNNFSCITKLKGATLNYLGNYMYKIPNEDITITFMLNGEYKTSTSTSNKWYCQNDKLYLIDKDGDTFEMDYDTFKGTRVSPTQPQTEQPINFDDVVKKIEDTLSGNIETLKTWNTIKEKLNNLDATIKTSKPYNKLLKVLHNATIKGKEKTEELINKLKEKQIQQTKDISTTAYGEVTKGAKGYVMGDMDFSAITEDNKIMGLGSNGPLVKKIQNFLLTKGFSGGTDAPITTNEEACKAKVDDCDGKYGKNTKAQVVKYQQSVSIQDDGLVGKQTYDAMKEDGLT